MTATYIDIPDLKWLDRMTKLMDSQFKIPGTNFRFGLDPLLGLIPVAGDLASLAISGGLVYYMAKHGVSKIIVLRMLGNIFLDAIIGSIPVLGNIFDFFFKPNRMNISLLKKYYKSRVSIA